MANNKQYGLIKPSHLKSQLLKKPSIFNDSDSDSETVKNRPTGLNKRLKTQDKINQNRAIEEDPTVYQYDEIYDELNEKRKQTKLAQKDMERKPKYIKRLLETAERRKRENERRIERQVQKEREEEGEEFKNKESFVTTAYKKKLEEMKELDEQDRREEYLESIGDVKKQGNLDGFYRHLYDQKVNFEDGQEEQVKIKKIANKREYRKRDKSKSDSDCEQNVEKIGHLASNLDADSDFSIDSSDEEDSSTEKTVKVKEESNLGCGKKIEQPKMEEEVKEVKSEEIVKKNKIDIWKKRTVGDCFQMALQRFFERKALRESVH